MEDHSKNVVVFKALADETRLKITEMLSCGEMCACSLLEYFDITQPTLSYHLKILTDSGVVISRKEGTWIMYSINQDVIKSIKNFWKEISEGKDDCICHNVSDSIKCE